MKLKSKQIAEFIWCPHPITIDRSDWGPGNIQNAPNGAYLKIQDGKISHLVQPNQDKTAPIGWRKNFYRNFVKEPVYLIREVSPGESIELDTLDGKIVYEVKIPSAIVCNELNGEPNKKDCWVQSIEELKKNYEF